MITELINNIQYRGVSETNKFLVYIPRIPDILRGNNLDSSGSLEFVDMLTKSKAISIYCTGINIPQMSYESNTRSVGASGNIKIPNGQTFGELTMNFMVDDNMTEYRFFEFWKTAIAKQNYYIKGNNGYQNDEYMGYYTYNYYDEYVSNIEIYKLNRQMQPVNKTVIYNCYPISSSGVTLDKTSANNAVNISVTLNYEKFDNYTYTVF